MRGTNKIKGSYNQPAKLIAASHKEDRRYLATRNLFRVKSYLQLDDYVIVGASQAYGH